MSGAPAQQRAGTALPAGGGEMGALMRSVDWGRTPVGPLETWPQSLRTAIGIMLETRFGMYVAWGRDYTQFYNDGYRPILGSTKHPALGKSARETFAESWHLIGPLFDSVMKGGAVGSDDWMLPLDRHGYLEECHFIYSYSPIRDESGGVGGVLVTVAESTERVLGERRLRTLRDLAADASEIMSVEQAWRRALEALRGNPDDIPFAVLYEIEPGSEAVRLLGSAGIPEGHPAAPRQLLLESGPWPVGRAVRTGLAETVSGLRERFGELPRGSWLEPPHTAVVLPIARPGLEWPYGVLVLGTSAGRALDDPYREFLDLVAGHIATAVSNARAHEDERRRAEALAELDRAKTAFFSNVSHEFRTPLTLILGPVEDLLAGRHGPLTAPQRREAEALHRSALRLLKLVNTLLDFSRIEAGRAEARFVPTDLAELTADLASTFRSAVERGGLRLEVDCPPLPEPVWVDRDMWEKIVLNLLSNAFKFTFEGAISVALAWRRAGVELQVRDTGTGIPPEELPHLFERFRRIGSARSRTHEGSGIGLSLVQELVRLHGGAVEAESTFGRGSVFTVRLPAGRAHLPPERVGGAPALAPTSVGALPFVEEALHWLPDEPPLPEKGLPEPPPEAAGEPGRGRILVADDNADMRDYLRRLLGSRWEVTAVADGDAALASARSRPPDLVLADVMMPGRDGFELLRALREDPATSKLPIVLLSARAGEEARVEGLAAGADDYLVKPFSARELVARVASQLALARARAEADALREQMYDLFLQAPTPICVLRGPDLVFELANPLYVQLTGNRPLLGKPLADAIPEVGEQGYLQVFRDILDSGETSVLRETFLQFDRLGSGTPEDTWWTVLLAPLRRADGLVDRIMVLAVEVTDQVVARREAEAANRAKDEFLAMLGHELRNPLAPILTALELMRQRAGSMFDRERDVIQRQVQHLVGLVDDLLDVSRITRGKVELKRRRIELSRAVAKAVEMASPLFEQRRHTLQVRVPATGLPVEADEGRLAQVFANLLTNAAKFTETGGSVEVAAEARGGSAVLTVTDTGIGIAPDLLPRVFELFFQGERTIERSHGGLGLGLAIVKSLTELHGGTISVESGGTGRGSRFSVSLPLSGSPRTAQAQPELEAERGATVSRRILVVDDNPDAAELMAEYLESLGHETRAVEDGPAALALAEEFRPEVAVLDIGLPVMDGYELAGRLKQGSPQLLCLIAVTGYGQDEDRERARQAGFDEHLVKPVDLAALRSRIDGLAAAPAGDRR